jgi:hypothetical protein
MCYLCSSSNTKEVLDTGALPVFQKHKEVLSTLVLFQTSKQLEKSDACGFPNKTIERATGMKKALMVFFKAKC